METLRRHIIKAAVAQGEPDQPGEIFIDQVAAHGFQFLMRPIIIGTLRPQDNVARLHRIGARFHQFRPAQDHKRMPRAGLHLYALPRFDHDLVLGRDVEFPNVRHLAQTALARLRVHG